MSTDSTDHTGLTIAAFHEQVRSGALTSADLVRWYTTRIATLDAAGPELRAIVTVNPQALADAEALDASFTATGQLSGPLHGVPVLVKDQAETAGLRTSFGSKLFEAYVPEQDATVVTRLREAGAVVLAKTTMCDFAAGWFSFSSLTGHTKNPFALDREAGGSSAGTAAGVAADLGLVGIGEDTGGSIRVPSSFCGLYGLRVTTGLVSRTGFSPLVHFQDTPGPIGRTVADVAAVLDVLVGYDPRDPFTSVVETRPAQDSYLACTVGAEPAGTRVGILTSAFGQQHEAGEVSDVVRRAVAALGEHGARVVDNVELDDLPGWIARTSLYSTQSKTDIGAFLAARPAAPVHSFQEVYASGAFHPLNDLFHDIDAGPDVAEDDPEYFRRRLDQERWRRALLDLMARSGVDVLVYPTVAVPAPTRQDLEDRRWTALTFPTNTVIASQTGLPAMTVPVGTTSSGLPVGMEVLGKPLSEPALLALAAAWEHVAPPRPVPLLEGGQPQGATP